MAVEWNVLTSPWLPVMDNNARQTVLSPLEALKGAISIRRLALASPLDLFAAHRFLLTLLYWKADDVASVRSELLKGNVPSNVLDQIEKETARFNLFDADAPFLQDPKVKAEKERKSVGSLFAEFACATNIAHFHHGDDEGMRLCLPCVTVGMVRLVPWTQSGGKGLSPSVHNAPPIMALAVGENLTSTLGLNLVSLPVPKGTPRWTGHFVPTAKDKQIPYMESLTWNPRRVHLGSALSNETCWRCGQQGVPAVGQIVYAKNENTQLRKKGNKGIPFYWADPAAFYSPETPYITIKSSRESLATNDGDLKGLIDRTRSQPTSIVRENNPAHKGWQLVVPSTNPANNKTFDHRLIETASLSPEVIKTRLPRREKQRPLVLDGWKLPRRPVPGTGSRKFVLAAVRLYSHADWMTFAAAAFKEMHQAPAAFDLLTGLLWPLRPTVSGLPSRNVAWLTLKLMAQTNSEARIIDQNAPFRPLDYLPKRQELKKQDGPRTAASYPVSLPQGHRLEHALLEKIKANLQCRKPKRIDWTGLCDALDQLLD